VALHWCREYVSNFFFHEGFLVFRIRQCHRESFSLSQLVVVIVPHVKGFMLAAGARPKETKINPMDCICLCSEVEISISKHLNFKIFWGGTPPDPLRKLTP